MSLSLEKKIYAAFSPEPLTAAEEELYVELDDVRGDSDVVKHMERRIRLSDNPIQQVIAGHKGCGKSTELYRLQTHLENDDAGQKYFVVFCQSSDDIDLYDLDFPDILVAICRQLVQQLEKRESITLQPGYFKELLPRFKKFLGQSVEMDNIKLSAGLFAVSGAIKGSPDSRHELRKMIDQETTGWIKAANDLIDQANIELQKKGYAGLVILVDDLDKIVSREHSRGVPTDEYLFVERAAQLTDFACHMVYSIPITLAYSHHEPTIASRFGGEVPVIPMVKVTEPPPSTKPCEAGIACLRELIEVRVKSCGVEMTDVFEDDATVEQLILLSGGQPTEVMTLVREAIIAEGLPIASPALERCVREGRREYKRQFFKEHGAIFDSVLKNGELNRSKDSDNTIRELLKSRAVLMYINGSTWYGLNPMVAAEYVSQKPQPKKTIKKKNTKAASKKTTPKKKRNTRKRKS